MNLRGQNKPTRMHIALACALRFTRTRPRCAATCAARRDRTELAGQCGLYRYGAPALAPHYLDLDLSHVAF